MNFLETSWRRDLFSLLGFIFLLTCLHFQTVNAELFKVIGPDQPVVAVLGKDAELSCHLSPVLSAEHMEVRWFRSSFQLVVHLYENGMDQNEHQIPEYRGRTELIRNYISCGIVSLRIYNIGPDDEGSYTCFFQSDTSYEDATLELKVAQMLTAEKNKLSADVGKLSAIVEMLTADKKMLTADKSKFSAVVESLHTELVDVTIDPETAHPILELSADRKSVSRGFKDRDLPDNPERFDTNWSVLGVEGFTSGRHYWEVEVEDGWRLGVCKDSVRRKGRGQWIHPSPQEGYWVLQLWYGEYSALTSPETSLSHRKRPQVLGIFLDYEAGKVSFYNADNKVLLFTFTDTFTEKLRPFFYTYNESPLRIHPMAAWE